MGWDWLNSHSDQEKLRVVNKWTPQRLFWDGWRRHRQRAHLNRGGKETRLDVSHRCLWQWQDCSLRVTHCAAARSECSSNECSFHMERQGLPNINLNIFKSLSFSWNSNQIPSYGKRSSCPAGRGPGSEPHIGGVEWVQCQSCLYELLLHQKQSQSQVSQPLA